MRGLEFELARTRRDLEDALAARDQLSDAVASMLTSASGLIGEDMDDLEERLKDLGEAERGRWVTFFFLLFGFVCGCLAVVLQIAGKNPPPLFHPFL